MPRSELWSRNPETSQKIAEKIARSNFTEIFDHASTRQNEYFDPHITYLGNNPEQKIIEAYAQIAPHGYDENERRQIVAVWPYCDGYTGTNITLLRQELVNDRPATPLESYLTEAPTIYSPEQEASQLSIRSLIDWLTRVLDDNETWDYYKSTFYQAQQDLLASWDSFVNE